MQDVIREHLVFLVDLFRRRSAILVASVLAAAALGVAMVKIFPKTYVSTSLILLQAANRTVGAGASTNAFGRDRALMQVAALSTWIKSDQVLVELVPQLYKPADYSDPSKAFSLLRRLRASLSLELVGGSTLEVSLAGGSPDNLARQLEVIVARILQGLTTPEASILSAPQFLAMKTREERKTALAHLRRRIIQVGFADADAVIRELEQPASPSLATQQAPTRRQAGGARQPEVSNETLRQSLAKSPALPELQTLFETYRKIEQRAAANGQDDQSAQSNWVSIFDAPENLLLIGRPKDPLYGESPAKKFAVLCLLLGIVTGLAAMIAQELVRPRPRRRSEFETIAGVPVVARLCQLPGDTTQPPWPLNLFRRFNSLTGTPRKAAQIRHDPDPRPNAQPAGATVSFLPRHS